MKRIEGRARTVRELLDAAKYTIDFYQREYAWQERQVRELVDDLTGKFLDFYDSGHARHEVEQYGHYFLGSIVISHKRSQRFIVDGQQRLTTLTLLLIWAEDRLLGREAWAFISALVVETSGKADLVAALESGARPWVARNVPSDHYTFAGEIPWHPKFAADALEESDPDGVYREDVPCGGKAVGVEVLAHEYAWESYHSEMNRAGNARVPSRRFAAQFDLRSTPQGFDQCLPDGAKASITLSGVDGLRGDVLYLREDLLGQYVGERDVVVFAFGERELRPYPPSPPQWLLDAQRQQIDAWQAVVTDGPAHMETADAE